MIATYHNHSTWSDGTTTIAELVAGAREQHIHELGISDHFVLHPRGRTPSWSMDPARLPEYVADVRSHTGATHPTVRLGLEVDWFPGHAEAIRAALAGIPFDYLIGSVHEVDGFVVDDGPGPWNALDEAARDEKHRQYWIHIESMARSGLFDIAAHLDLTKKFGHQPTADLSAEIGRALDAIADAGMVVEVNTAGWHKPVRQGYPSLDILRQCRARDIAVTISADAHEPGHLLRDFPRAVQLLERAGYDAVTRFAGRKRTTEHLESALLFV